MKTQKGFTLIELLVVISIIALLLSILTPALSMAKEKARRLVCSANLKSMGTGLHFYTGDYDEKAIPMANLDGKETYDLDGKNILPWFGYVVGEDVDDPYLKAVNLGKLFSEQIVEVPDIFYCPHGRAHAIGKGSEVRTQFALDYLAVFAWMNELNGIFEADDVQRTGCIQVVNHRCKRR